MPTYRWTVNMMEPGLRALQYKFNKIKYKFCLREIEKRFMNCTKAHGIQRRRDEVMLRKYYEGFNTGREKQMFKEELGDLEIQYKYTLQELHKKVEDCLPSLLYYMEQFVTLHKQNEAVREKLDTLLAKMGREPSEEDNGGDDE